MVSFFKKDDNKGAIRVGSASNAVRLDTAKVVNGGALKDDGPISRPALQIEEEPLITAYPEVGKYVRLLSGGEPGSVYKPSKNMEYSVAALELGPHRAKLLFDPEANRKEVGSELQELRVKLTAAGYNIEGRERRCVVEVLRQLIDEHRAKAGSSTFDASNSNSAAKKFWDAIVEIAVRERATDIHIQIVNNSASIKIRVDGELEPIPDFAHCTATEAERAVSWAYTNATQTASNSNSTFDRSSDLYTMIKSKAVLGKQIALRFQSLRGQYGPKITCRLLNVDFHQPTLTYEQLGYAPSQIMLFEESARTSAGLVIILGITGSGKTTTTKTYIETHPNAENCAFYSLEDPIEYPLKNVHQYPIQRNLLDAEASALSYASAVAGLMRSDLDAAIVGEIRDPATVATVDAISDTGHLAIGTLHAHLLTGLAPRLEEKQIGMSRESLTAPNKLNMAVYQALVPLLCEHCKINGADEAKHHLIRQHRDLPYVLTNFEKRFGLGREKFFFRREGGCPECSGRGTLGLSVVAEMLIPDQTWLDLTRAGRDHDAMLHYRSKSDGDYESENMDGKTVFEHTLYKVLKGNVDPRQCERFASLARYEIIKKN